MTPAKILVVDDEAELERLIRQRFRKKIKAKEVDFIFAMDGQAALAQLQADPEVDMVITDINMPRMDGLTFLGELAGLDRTLRAVIISAYSDMPNIRKAMNQGAFDFLTKPIDFQDLELTIQKALAAVQQMREKQQQVQQFQEGLVHDVYHDSLTGLPNRAWFSQHLAQRIDHQDEFSEDYAVLFIDLDGFKLVNDHLGHLAGDQLLKCVSLRLQACLRAPDAVARLGGDEFVILLESIQNAAEVHVVAERILARLQQPFQIDGQQVPCGASIGVALGRRSYTSSEGILHDADLAMYCAKRQGKGRYEIFDPSMRSSPNDLSIAIQSGLPWPDQSATEVTIEELG